MSHYFNTTKVSGDQLKLFVKQAKSQEDRILEFLKEHPYHWYTNEAIKLLVLDYRTPITSVRRAVTGLHNQGKIEKSPTANGMGEYGHAVHTWRFKP